MVISVFRNLHQTNTAKRTHNFFVHVLIDRSFKFGNKLSCHRNAIFCHSGLFLRNFCSCLTMWTFTRFDHYRYCYWIFDQIIIANKFRGFLKRRTISAVIVKYLHLQHSVYYPCYVQMTENYLMESFSHLGCLTSIFIFCFGVRSPCLMMPTTHLSSSLVPPRALTVGISSCTSRLYGLYNWGASSCTIRLINTWAASS